MPISGKPLYLSLLLLALSLFAPTAHAAMVGSAEIVQQQDKQQLISTLQREEVQQQLVEMGVDPAAAIARVDQMTNEEIAELNNQIQNMPAGAGLSTIEWLLIIIIIIILV